MANPVSRPPYPNTTPQYLDLYSNVRPPTRGRRVLLAWAVLILFVAAIVIAYMLYRVLGG